MLCFALKASGCSKQSLFALVTLEGDDNFLKMAAKGNKIELSTFQRYGKSETTGYKTADKMEKRLLISSGWKLCAKHKETNLAYPTLIELSFALARIRVAFIFLAPLPISSGSHFKCSYKCDRICKFIFVCNLLHKQNCAHEKD